MLRTTPFHLVDNSPWPFFTSIIVFNIACSLVSYMHINLNFIFFFFMLLMVILLMWWRDVVGESTVLSFHTFSIKKNIMTSMVWFILSEIMFFFGFFWSIFHSSLSLSVDVVSWPLLSVECLNPLSIPLLNTVVLVSSGFTVTWSHYSILLYDLLASLLSLMYSVLLSFFFTVLQINEYYDTSFMINSSIYGSCFFMTTGFHSFHVMVGSVFLFVCLVRMKSSHFTNNSHVGYECAIWYWHFVDVVWIFLYLSLYCWSSL